MAAASRCARLAAARLVTGCLVAACWLLACQRGKVAGNPERPPDIAPKITAGQGIELVEPCTPTGPELCFNARDDNCNGLIDEGCGVRTGLVQFVIAWPEAAADLDLEVTDPLGELAEIGRPTKSGLVKERDCPGPNGECRGQNLENVYLEQGDPVRGRYRVRVRLEKLGDAPAPIRCGFGARIGAKSYSGRLELSRPGDNRDLEFQL